MSADPAYPSGAVRAAFGDYIEDAAHLAAEKLGSVWEAR